MPHAPEESGMVRINHDNAYCSGSSKSMTIRRHDDGHVSCKCFRCGGWGSFREDEYRYYEGTKRIRSSTTDSSKSTSGIRNVAIPSDSTGIIGEWGIRERDKLRQYGISEHQVSRYGITYSKKYNRVIFPVWHEGKLVAWQGRSYYDDPKYITKCDKVTDLWVYFKSDVDSDLCVVVEDFYSGIRVAKYANAMVMLGGDLSDSALNYMTDKCDKFLIYNDFDTDQIIMNAWKLKERLTLMGYDAIVSSIGRDPKELSELELEVAIGEVNE